MANSRADIVGKVEEIADRDGRYPPRAYIFVVLAVEHAVSKLPLRRHITAAELLSSVRETAVANYGPMAKTVLNHWKIYGTDDVGEIVYNLIAAGELARSETDSKEDFRNVYDFEDVFVRDFKW